MLSLIEAELREYLNDRANCPSSEASICKQSVNLKMATFKPWLLKGTTEVSKAKRH